MKKLLFLLLAAAAVTACDNDEERNGKQSAVYDGTLIVTDNTKTPPETATSKNVRYELAESNDGTITLTMPGIKFVSNTRRIDHFIFCTSWMNTSSVNFDFCTKSIEVFIFYNVNISPINSISILSVEIFNIKMITTMSNFFIRRKSNTNRAVRYLLGLQVFNQCHNLSNSGFIVSSQNGCAVGRDQCVAG